MEEGRRHRYRTIAVLNGVGSTKLYLYSSASLSAMFLGKICSFSDSTSSGWFLMPESHFMIDGFMMEMGEIYWIMIGTPHVLGFPVD